MQADSDKIGKRLWILAVLLKGLLQCCLCILPLALPHLAECYAIQDPDLCMQQCHEHARLLRDPHALRNADRQCGDKDTLERKGGGGQGRRERNSLCRYICPAAPER